MAVCVSVCLSLAAFPHCCTDPDVTWGNGGRCPLVVHCWANLQSVHGFRCYGSIAPNAECQRVLVLALCLIVICTRDYYTSPPGRVRSVAVSVSVDLCTSVPTSVSQKSHVQTSRDFQYVLPGSVLCWRQCNELCILLVLRMTSRFHITRQIQTQACCVRRSKLFTVTRQVAPLNWAPGNEVCYHRLPCYQLSSAKTAEPMDMSFGMWTRVAQGTAYYTASRSP